jgi:D-alanyl-D-alanine carboxypeptidase
MTTLRRLAPLLCALLVVTGLPANAAGLRPAPAASSLPPLNTTMLGQATAAVSDSGCAATLVTVTGSAGSWAGTSGVADLATGSPVRGDEEFRIGSVSKVFVATVVMQLVAAGRIALADPIQHYLPGLLPAGDPPVTIAELLNHTSGLGPANGPAASGTATWFLAHRLDTLTTDQLLGTALRQPLLWAPGTHQQYNGVNYVVLGMLITRVTGRSYAAEIQQRILRPLGLTHTFVPLTDPRISGPYLHGYYADPKLVDITEQSPTLYDAQGAMISTTGDLTRFLTALLAGDLLPPAELRDMLTVPPVASGPIRYGMGLMSYTFPNGLTVWGHTGETPGYYTAIFTTPDRARVLAYAFTPIGPSDDNQVTALSLRIASTAFTGSP